jgi:hypothetical protein
LSDERRYDVPVSVIAFIDLPTGHWPQFTRPVQLGQAILASVGPA